MWLREGVLGLSTRVLLAVMVPALLVSAAVGLAYAGLGLSVAGSGAPRLAGAILEAAVTKGSVGPLAAAGLGAWSVGGLFAHGRLATALWLCPRRGVLALRGALDVLAAAALLGAVAALGVCGAVVALTSVHASLADLASITARHVLVCAVYGVSGAAVAVLLRSRSGAISLVLGWALLAEPTLRAAARLSELEPLRIAGQAFPGGLAERLQLHPGNPVVSVDTLLSAGVAMSALLVLAAVLAAGAWSKVQRLDA